MIVIGRPVWFALTVAACAAQPKPIQPIAGKAVASDVKLAAGTPLPLNDDHERIHFEPNGVGISATEVTVLDTVVQRLSSDPALDLQISGHTDPSELDADNTGAAGLSYTRANAVRDYLIAHSIAERRLVIRAVGATEPRDTNATSLGRTANRRVEFERVTIKVNSSGGRVVVTDTDVAILDPVSFEPDNDVITRTSFPALDAVAATLQADPSILLVEVQSHTDERGDARFNLRLTEARALAVMNYLIAKGVDRARLVAQGYGGTQPLDASHNEAAWAKNRRVAFLVLKRSP
jgi:outer membrane protein OmpA-like peptidoglycan-associated protein